MSKYKVKPTNREVFFREEDIIVSKTDLKGRITYANDVFLDIAGYRENEVLGEPHSIIRHPMMPRCVFKFLWETIQAKNEIFAYVVNMARNGDHYWVFAHVTPTLDLNEKIVGYHSNRRVPERKSIENIESIYADLLSVESQCDNQKEGMTRSLESFNGVIAQSGMDYEQLIFSI